MADLIIDGIMFISKKAIGLYYLQFSPFFWIHSQYGTYEVKNILTLLSRSAITNITIFFLYHFHFLLYLLYTEKLSLFRTIILLIFTIAVSIGASVQAEKISFLVEKTAEAIFFTFYLITWGIHFIFYLLTYNETFLDIITFKKNPIGITDSITILLQNTRWFFVCFCKNIIFLLHCPNFLSLVRIIEISHNTNPKTNFSNYICSLSLIPLDYILGFLYVFNFIFFVSFIKMHKKIIQADFVLSLNEKTSPFYKAIAIHLILNTFISNIENLFAFIVSIASLVFFWRVKKIYKIYSDFSKDKLFGLFCIRVISNMVKGFIQIFSLIFYIVIHIIPTHYSCYYKINKIIPNNREALFFVFHQSWLDLVVTIFSLFRILTVDFLVYMIRQKGHITYFPLNSVDFPCEKGKEPSEVLVELKKKFTEKRRKLLTLSFWNIVHTLLLSFIIKCLINNNSSFFRLKFAKSLIFFFYASLFNQHHEIPYKKLSEKFLAKTVQISFDIISFPVYFMISAFLMAVGPWTIPYKLDMVFKKVDKYIYKIENFRTLSMKREYYEKDKPVLINIPKKRIVKLKNHLKLCFYGYIYIFKFLFIHLNCIRAFYMWKNFSSENRKKEKFTVILNRHFIYAVYEIWFLPFFFIMLIIEPWNFKRMKSFIKASKFSSKMQELKQISWLFFLDIFTLFAMIFLLLSIIDTYSCLMLIIRTLNKNLFKSNSLAKEIYDAHYKKDFRTELKILYYKNLKKIFVLLLYFTDYLLIIHADHLFIRTKPFVIDFLKRIKLNIFSLLLLFKPSKRQNQAITLSSLPPLCTTTICEFLPVTSVVNLSLSCHSLSVKTKSNILWKQIYFNYYKKRLRNNIPREQFLLFDPERYDNYKEACKQVTELILSRNKLKSNELRDKIIGFYRIVEEETIETFVRFPNMILFPYKLIGLYIFKLNQVNFSIYCHLAQRDLIYSPAFYDIHRALEGYFCLYNSQDWMILGTFVLLFFWLIIMPMQMFFLIIKLVCFAPLRINSLYYRGLNTREKIRAVFYPKRVIQCICYVVFLFLHAGFDLLPIVYYYRFYCEKGSFNFKEVKLSNFFLTIPINFAEILNWYWNRPFPDKVFLVFGKYCLIIPFSFLNMRFKYLASKHFKGTEIFFYSLIKKHDNVFFFSPLISFLYLSRNALLFFRCISACLDLEGTIVEKCFYNFIGIMFTVSPFISLFYLERNFFLILLVAFYSISNTYLITRWRRIEI